MPISSQLTAIPTIHKIRIATPVPTSPLTIDPTPGMKNEIIRLTAGFFGAITMAPGCGAPSTYPLGATMAG